MGPDFELVDTERACAVLHAACNEAAREAGYPGTASWATQSEEYRRNLRAGMAALLGYVHDALRIERYTAERPGPFPARLFTAERLREVRVEPDGDATCCVAGSDDQWSVREFAPGTWTRGALERGLHELRRADGVQTEDTKV